MERFNYRAKDKNGKLVTGKVEAPDEVEAARLLRKQGLVVIEISAENRLLQGLEKILSGRISFNDLTIFTRQFAIMVSAGIPITEGLLILRAQAKPALQAVLRQILQDVEAGNSLGDAFAKHKKVFSSVYIALIRSGEEGGILDKVLTKLAATMESQREFRSRVKGALIYPTIIVVGMIAVITIMIVFVVPKLAAFYKEFNAELPGPTQFLITLSDFAVRFWWIILAAIVGTIWTIVSFSKTEAGRQKFDAWKLKLPVVGRLQQQFMLVEMSRILGLLVGAGVPVLEALRVSANVVGNFVLKNAILKVAEQVEKGFSMSQAFSQEPELFPALFHQMVVVGEETGKMDESLLKIATVYEQEADQSVKNLMSLIEPLIMVILGLGVGFLALSIILPIYSLSSKL